MKTLFFSPLAPALIFLAGAFIMLIIQYFRGEYSARYRSYVGLGISGFVFVVLAVRTAIRLTSSSFEPPLVFSPWGFVATGLTIRLDGMGLAFLFIPVLLLIAIFWAKQVRNPAIALGLAGGSALIFVAANGISLSYALILFDAVGCIYWLRFKHPNMALARLLLGMLTTSALMLTGLGGVEVGAYLLTFSMWLRLSLFPFVEATAWSKDKPAPGDTLIWFSLSTAAGLYILARFIVVPPHISMQIITLLVILLNAWLSWVASADSGDLSVKLLRLSLIQPALALLISPLSVVVTIALGLGYTLSLGALWLTPQIGRPNLLERHWLWIYAAPILATLTLIGFPYTFGWVSYRGIFGQLLFENALIVVAILILSEGIALSALYHYWERLLKGQDKADATLLTALVLTIPFLLPWVAGITFKAITGLDFLADIPQVEQTSLMGPGMIFVWLLALGFGFGRPYLLAWFKLSPQTVQTSLGLRWIWPLVGKLVGLTDALLLRGKAIFEGGHYLGWAFLVALAGLLVVVLS